MQASNRRARPFILPQPGSCAPANQRAAARLPSVLPIVLHAHRFTCGAHYDHFSLTFRTINHRAGSGHSRSTFWCAVCDDRWRNSCARWPQSEPCRPDDRQTSKRCAFGASAACANRRRVSLLRASAVLRIPALQYKSRALVSQSVVSALEVSLVAQKSSTCRHNRLVKPSRRPARPKRPSAPRTRKRRRRGGRSPSPSTSTRYGHRPRAAAAAAAGPFACLHFDHLAKKNNLLTVLIFSS